MGWVDSHCHLDFNVFEQDTLFKQLIEQDCEAVLVPATQSRYFERIMGLKQAYPELVHVALGLHPYFLSEHTKDDLQRLDTAISKYQPVAMGEFGLDFMLNDDSIETQMYFFHQQLEMAKSYKLPLVIHCRKAHDRLASETKKTGFQCGGLIHGFSGSMQQAKRYIDLGFVLGLGGALTFDRAKAMHKMVAALPDDAYTLETDSPDMSPSFALGQVNTPLNIPQIASYVADLRQQTVDCVIENSRRNFYRVLDLPAK